MDEGLTERFTSTLAPLLPSIRESKSARYGRGERKIYISCAEFGAWDKDQVGIL